MVGTKLAHYEVVRKIGSGGMGDVYAARDTKLGREVALKVLPVELARHDERRKRFVREARSAAALSHPNIVTLYSVEEADGECFLTMELVDGATLASAIPKEGLAVETLLRLAVPLAEAVAAAHDQGIVHRDLKPQNVMTTRDGAVKVLDFGLAKAALSEEEQSSAETLTSAPTTGEGRILGTPAYMSPEQAEGVLVDHRTDMFSLGVMLYEMATGQRPFTGDSSMSVISSVLKDTPPSITELRNELPRRLGRIVARCLAKDRRNRYQSAHDLAADLRDLRADAGELASSTELTAQTPLPARRRGGARWALVAGSLLAAASLGAVGQRFLSRHGEATAATAVPADGSGTSAPAAKRFVRLTTQYGVEVGPQIAPDGKWFVYAANTDGNPENADVYRQRVGGRVRTNLTEDCQRNDQHPAISPDGERIAFRSDRDGGGIFVMGATGESVRRVTDFGFHPAWARDGKHLVVCSVSVLNPRDRGASGVAWEVEVESGAKRRIEAGSDAVHGSYSPDGKWLAFDGLKGGSVRNLFTVAREGGEPRLLLDGGQHSVWTPVWAPDGDAIYFSTVASGEMNISRIALDRATGKPKGPAEPVTAGASVSASWPSLSADGKRLLFSVSNTTGNIAKVRFDPVAERVEGAPVLLTRGTNGFAAPDVSPDGEWLTFSSSWIRHDTDENVYVSRVDGSALRALTSDEDKGTRLPRWTARGDRLVFYSNRSGEWEHWSVRPDGSGLQMLTDTPGQATLFLIPAKNGSRAAGWINEGGLFLYDLDKPYAGQKLERIPYERAAGAQFIPTDWSPDGRYLVGSNDSTDAPKLVRYSLESKQYDTIADGYCPRYLPDGKRLLYTDVTGLRLFDLPTKHSTLLLSVAPDAVVGHVGFSPDVRWIYFSLATEDGDVWMAELE